MGEIEMVHKNSVVLQYSSRGQKTYLFVNQICSFTMRHKGNKNTLQIRIKRECSFKSRKREHKLFQRGQDKYTQHRVRQSVYEKNKTPVKP